MGWERILSPEVGRDAGGDCLRIVRSASGRRRVGLSALSYEPADSRPGSHAP